MICLSLRLCCLFFISVIIEPNIYTTPKARNNVTSSSVPRGVKLVDCKNCREAGSCTEPNGFKKKIIRMTDTTTALYDKTFNACEPILL